MLGRAIIFNHERNQLGSAAVMNALGARRRAWKALMNYKQGYKSQVNGEAHSGAPVVALQWEF